MSRPARLSSRFVRVVKLPGRYSDGRGAYGLTLLVRRTSSGRLSKSFQQRVRINGRVHSLGLGSWPVTTLAIARAAALENAKLARQGKEPRHIRKRSVPTLRELSEKVIEERKSIWKNDRSAQEWRGPLTRYVYPVIGDMAVDRISTADVLRVLRPIWSSRAVTARRLRSRISIFTKVAIAEQYREDDPAGDAIIQAMPNGRHQAKRMPSVPHPEVREALDRIRSADAHLGTRLCLEFLALTATRSQEARGALWGEIDSSTNTWTVPSYRRKNDLTDLRVPLSTGALDVLVRARALDNGSGLIFPAVRGGLLNANAPSTLMRNLDLAGRPHGWRASFSTWAADTGQNSDVTRLALGHRVPSVFERYQRSDLLAMRAKLMEEWSQYIWPRRASI